MARIACQSAGYLFRWQHAHVSVSPDHVRPDEKLLRFAVDHAVCRSATHAFGTDDLSQLWGDFIKLIARAKGKVRPVSDDPQPIRPWHHRSRAAFALVVVHRQMRINAGDAARLFRTCDQSSGKG